MLSIFRNLLLGKRKQKGFTMIETLMAISMTVVVLLSVALAATFSLQWNSLEKSRTLAQDIARNIMSQHVRTVKFEELKALNTSAPLETNYVLFESLNNKVVISKLVSTSIVNDLRKLDNSKCAMIIKQLSDPKQLEVAVRIQWHLTNTGQTDPERTKTVELTTVASQGDMNLKRAAKFADPLAAKAPPSSSNDCSPVCVNGYYCNSSKVCVENPTCTTGQELVNGVCENKCDPLCLAGFKCVPGTSGNTCKQMCSSMTPCPTGQICDGNGLCIAAAGCTADSSCPITQRCDLTITPAKCVDALCSTPCAVNTKCSHGTCITANCLTDPTAPCPGGYTCNSTGTCESQSFACSPACKTAQHEKCVLGKCEDSCTFTTGRDSGCSCTLHSQCTSGTCKTNGNKCQ